MSILSFILSHKIEFLVGAVASTAALTYTVASVVANAPVSSGTTPVLNEQGDQPSDNPEGPKLTSATAGEVKPGKGTIATRPNRPKTQNKGVKKTDPNFDENLLVELKREKEKLVREISDFISNGSSLMRNLAGLNQLDAWMKECQKKVDNVETTLTTQDRKDIKAKYDELRSEINKVTDMQGGKVRIMNHAEIEADRKRESIKQDYEIFKDKYDMVKKDFDLIKKKDTYNKLNELKEKIESKLKKDNNQCLFKDTIQTNDRIGTRRQTTR